MASSDRPLLLDVNALLALAWPNHQFHRVLTRRLDRRPSPRWATCALTQLGFVRLSSNPSVVQVRKTPLEALALLAHLVEDAQHVFLERLPALPAVAKSLTGLLGHQQVTDGYLCAVADRHGATLLTLDRTLGPRPHVEIVDPS
jgi:toxin-antitoxin system PIN domain toxin